jgi:hypothetical protein
VGDKSENTRRMPARMHIRVIAEDLARKLQALLRGAEPGISVVGIPRMKRHLVRHTRGFFPWRLERIGQIILVIIGVSAADSASIENLARESLLRIRKEALPNDFLIGIRMAEEYISKGVEVK